VKWAGLIFGVVAVLLGGLWLLQGLDLIRIDPIACVGACEPLEGGSTLWAIVGFIVLAAGAGALLYAARRFRR
jgi:ascorbate-specific PTS system EIIC-type component UlaA